MITPEQFNRWQDFSLRMARACFRRNRNPCPAEIEANVKHFFDCLDPEDLTSFVNWDHSAPYPEGSPRHGTDSYDHPNHAMLITDICKEHEDGWNPHYWEDCYGQATEERHYEQFVAPVVCCIRAGLDMVVGSTGVLGFTAGDLRKMYPEGIPDWVTGGPEHHWSHWPSGEVNGTFAEMEDTDAIAL